MTSMKSSDSRFEIVTAGHHLLLRILPLRMPDSRTALENFIAAADRVSPVPADLESVLIRCLTVLQKYTTTQVPTLVERYLASTSTSVEYIARFAQCVEELLRYQGITDAAVQDAIQLIGEHYAEPGCDPQYVAERVGISLSTLAHKFESQVGGTLTNYIRNRRLEQAAVLLSTTLKSIKEVWAEVGYNFHSNFDRDFKKRFRYTPRQYRARTLRPLQQLSQAALPPQCANDGLESTTPSTSGMRILIVDDDEYTRTTLAYSLRLDGYLVSTAATGSDALEETACRLPEAILIDYRLEDMDGVEVLRRLRRQRGGTSAAVALFTADWDLLDRAEEVAALDAMVASKLCDLERVNDLLTYLLTTPPVRQRSQDCVWREWIPFL